MDLIEFTKRRPKRYTEECALASVFLNLTELSQDWLLNYISPPGGAWQEFYVYVDGNRFKFYIGRDTRRVDLVLQKGLEHVLFFIAEAKETFKRVLSERENIMRNMIAMYDTILNFEVDGEKLFPDRQKIRPVFALIAGIDTTNLGEFVQDVINSEVKLIERSIDRLPQMFGGKMCVVAYWEKTRTRFRLIFSSEFDAKLRDYFEKVFQIEGRGRAK